ncbi:Hypothetical protein SRAE_0000072300 [Strongyloides ratti]|uniref:Uncharacterized protein n=1 Tax=Strongyloides ratti TaxID=34506 RepID=A0A090KW07_STRRB|nr:Hypothetical protein SRAE_0000072300 [Strongyloides ratti]CEF61606.1 Hypothetical protein SRAE_0000072300 [Strongyloides ratti]
MTITSLERMSYKKLRNALRRTYGHHFLQSRVLLSLIEAGMKKLPFCEAIENIAQLARKLDSKFLTKENFKIILVLMSSEIPHKLRDRYLSEICAENSKIKSLTDLDQ